MKKKIVSAVLALLMVASAMPMSDFASFVPDTSITAVAANKQSISVAGYDIECTYVDIDKESNTRYLKLTVPQQARLFDKTENLTIDSSVFENALKKAGIAYSGGGIQYVELNYNIGNVKEGKNKYYSSLAHVVFKGNKNFKFKIGPNMFAGLTNLQTADLNGVVSYIGTSAFANCTNFVGTPNKKKKNTMYFDGVAEIDSSAFSGCKSLAGLELGTVSLIGKSTFQNCIKLKEVTIPASVWLIGANAFSSNTGLEKVVFANGSKLRAAGDYIFSDCTLLSKVFYGNGTVNTLPPSLMGDKDNYEKEPKQEGSNRFDWLGRGLFSGCTALQTFVIPKGLQYVPTEMFKECTTLRKVSFGNLNKNDVNASCHFIGAASFQSCPALEEISLPNNCLIINQKAFNACAKLRKVIVSDKLFALGALYYADGEDSDEKICRFQCGTFASCPVLSFAPRSKEKILKPNQIIMPDKVSYIPTMCFSGCTGVTNVQMSKVKDIGDSAFQKCYALPNVTVPDAVVTIRNNVFQDCKALKSVVYSKNLQEIWSSAFKGCTVLANATPSGTKSMTNTVIIPASCMSVEKNAFENCVSFKYLNVLGGANSHLATLGESAFANCTSLEGSTQNGTSNQELNFPKGVTVIHPKVFTKCTNLKTIRFAGNVTSIGDSAFEKCPSLKKVTVNDTIQQIGLNAFKECTSLSSLPVTAKGKVAFTQLEDIKNGTFQGCTSLKTADMSGAKNISAIGNNAFEKCSALTKVVLPNNGRLESIGDYAFNSCSALALVTDSASNKNSKIPNTVKSIGKNAFSGTDLRNMTIVKPKDSTAYNTIGDSAFSNCKKLKTVDFSGSNLTTLEKNIFSTDTELVSVKLPTTLTKINDNAFAGCVKLSMINSTKKGEAILPSKLKTIANQAFKDCHCLARMVIPAATDDIALSAWNFSLKYTPDDLKTGKINPLKEIVVNSKNANYKSIAGVMYNKSGTELLLYPVMKPDTSFTVPSTVTTITDSAFSSNNYIQNVTIPASVKKIEQNAFNKCESLKTVKFGNNKTVSFNAKAFTGLTGKPMVAFYAAKGSSAEKYARANSKVIKFIDNNKVAAKLTLAEGSVYYAGKGRFQLTPVLTTAKGEKTTDVLEWTSSDTSIATVDNEGFVTPRKTGKAIITVKSSGGLTTKITVNIGDAVERIAGSRREYTATAISEKCYTSADTVIVTTGYDFHDALISVPLAKAYNAPILLVHMSLLHDDVKSEIKRLGAKNIIVVNTTGTKTSISSKLITELRKLGKVTPVSANSYLKTSEKVAEKLRTQIKTNTNGSTKAPSEVFFVTNAAYADALSVSPVAAIKGAPIIYVDPKAKDLDATVKSYLASIKNSVKKVYIVGGTVAMPTTVEKSIKKVLSNVRKSNFIRFAGARRYETCIMINKYFTNTDKVLTSKSLCVAKGLDFPDALAGGVLAASMKAPLFLADQVVNPDSKKAQVNYLKSKKADRIIVFGGKVAVPDQVVNFVKNPK